MDDYDDMMEYVEKNRIIAETYANFGDRVKVQIEGAWN